MSVYLNNLIFISDQLIDKMPRSNKKKHVHHQEMRSSDVAIKHLLSQEKSLMISRAIVSANKHGIKLEHGSSNPGLGDCAFEAVIQNNNDRQCFREKLPMSIGWYRRIWVTDMANRTVNSSWNTLGRQKWLEGWQEMLVPGTYERGIFGDLMLPGIACGVKKILLIFNTNLESPHDPIYVVDPRQFNVNPDTELPIVLAYNLSHYESMNPCTEADNNLTAALVKEYCEGRYKYSRTDLPFFLTTIASEGQQIRTNSEDIERKSRSKRKFTENHGKEKADDEINLEEIDTFLDSGERKSRSKRKCTKNHGKENADDEINLEEIDKFLDNNQDFLPTPIKRTKAKPLRSTINPAEINDFQDKQKDKSGSIDNIENLSYQLKDGTEPHSIRKV